MSTAVRARAVVVDADRPPVRDGAVVIADGTIAAVGPAEAILAAHPDAADGGAYDVVLPGLVDAHSHARRTPLAAHGVGAPPLERFLVELTAMTPLPAADEALLAGTAALATGVTAVQAIAHSFAAADGYRDQAVSVLEGLGRSGVRARVALGLTDRDEWAPGGGPVPDRGLAPDAFADVARSLLGARAGDAEIDAAGPVAPQWCSDAALAAVVSAGARRVHAHLLESRRQKLLERLPDGGGDPVARLAAAGLLGPHASFAHGVWLDDRQVAALAAAGAVVVHCPGSNALTASGTLRVRTLLDAGVPVALGLDSHTPSEPPDVFAELRRALAAAHELGAPLSPAEGLRMLLAGGAAALGGAALGRLDPGVPADLVALELPHAPLDRDPVAAVVDHASRSAVRRVWVAGDVRHPLPPDVAEVAERAASRCRDALAADAEVRAWRRHDAQGAWAAVDAAWHRAAQRAMREDARRGAWT